jgi:putative hydrolase of the HAD superfamily
MIRVILFDLDDTLYPPGTGIMEEIRDHIHAYILERFGLSEEETDALRRRYLQEYGTTMRGLQINHQIDADEFLDYVHDIPVHRYLQPNPQLDAVLTAIPHEKVIFTNADRNHAERVLQRLGIRHHFVRIVDIHDMNFESKPQPSAYTRICDMLGVAPEQCLLVEDSARNLQPARELGMRTVLVRDGHSGPEDAADHVIDHIEEIGELIELHLGPAP